MTHACIALALLFWLIWSGLALTVTCPPCCCLPLCGAGATDPAAGFLTFSNGTDWAACLNGLSLAGTRRTSGGCHYWDFAVAFTPGHCASIPASLAGCTAPSGDLNLIQATLAYDGTLSYFTGIVIGPGQLTPCLGLVGATTCNDGAFTGVNATTLALGERATLAGSCSGGHANFTAVGVPISIVDINRANCVNSFARVDLAFTS